MSTYLLNLLSCPYPSTPPRIITALLFQAYTYSWMMLLIVLYDGAVLGWMTRYTYCMSGAMKIHLDSSIVVVSTSTVDTILTYTFLNKTAPLCRWAEACFNISSTLI